MTYLETTRIENVFNDAIWEDANTPDTFPTARPLLAHYTTIQTLEAVLTNDEMWLSHPFLMNDFEELRFGITEAVKAFRLHDGIRQVCESFDDSYYSSLMTEFERKLERISSDSIDTYVTCFSEHTRNESGNDGILSMWRGYGANGHGAAIIFDTTKINALQNSPLILSKVFYGSTNTRKTWITKKLDQFAQLLASSKVEKNLLYIPIHHILERFKLFALFSKHDGFKEENEWRLVYLKDRDRENRLSSMLSYSITSNGIQPKLKLKIGPVQGVMQGSISLSEMITQIILGPSISNHLTLKTVERMVAQLNKPELIGKIVGSSTPFRPT